MHHRGRTTSLLALAAVPVVLAGCQPGSGTDGEAGSRAGVSAAAAGGPGDVVPAGVRGMVVVGDSITAGGQPIRDRAVGGRASWIPSAVGPQVQFRGGWATDGATTADMRAAATPMDADVLVLMGGTNDLMRGRPWEQVRADLLAVVATVGVEEVLLAALPPNDRLPAERLTINAQLQALAAEQGWDFVDPWTRAAEAGAYRPGASTDGVHPTERVAADAGVAIQAALLDGATDGPR